MQAKNEAHKVNSSVNRCSLLDFTVRRFEMKKEYITPQFESIDIGCCDVITSSAGTETTPIVDKGGIWDLDLEIG